jgi:hypothetical protein
MRKRTKQAHTYKQRQNNYNNNIFTCWGVGVTDIVSSRFDWLDLLSVSVTTSLDYNSSRIWLPLVNESLTVAWILH